MCVHNNYTFKSATFQYKKNDCCRWCVVMAWKCEIICVKLIMETSQEQFTGICTTQNSWLNFTDIKNRAIWFEINGPKNVKNNNSENSLIRKKKLYLQSCNNWLTYLYIRRYFLVRSMVSERHLSKETGLSNGASIFFSNQTRI